MMPAERYQDVIALHHPKGYRLKERKLRATHGFATFRRDIVCEPIRDNAALFVYLHECGHVHARHLHDVVQPKNGFPDWRAEYEADQYAIVAMRAHKLSIPRARSKEAKEVLREYIVRGLEKGEHIDDEVLRYAYGKEWRKHR